MLEPSMLPPAGADLVSTISPLGHAELPACDTRVGHKHCGPSWSCVTSSTVSACPLYTQNSAFVSEQ